MGGGRRSSTALLLLLLALMLAGSSTTTAAAAQCRQPPAANGSYKLITVWNSRGGQVRIAARADDSSIAGFANGNDSWVAIQGSEEPFRNGHGVVNLLGALVKKNATS